MLRLRLFVLASLLVLSSCATLKTPTEEATQQEAPAPELVEALPKEIGSFDYEGHRFFEDESSGYTLRYSNRAKQRMADIYVYPVADQNQDLDHEDLVMGSTRATIAAIGDAVKAGLYANFNVVGAATQARGLRTVARVEATYLRQNLASYTLVYQTEYDGTLLKIRLSMPENEANRSSSEWDAFAETIFDSIVNELDDQRAAQNSNVIKKSA